MADVLAMEQHAQEAFTMNPAISFTNVSELDPFMDFYFENPHPERISSMLELLAKQSDIPLVAIAALTGFLAEVIRNNPDLESGWNYQITRGCPVLRQLYASARELNTESILNLEPSDANNDLLWGALRGGGNLDYVGKIIENLQLIESGEGKQQLRAGVTAKWSLAVHVDSYEAIRSYVQLAGQSYSGIMAQHIDDVLNKSMQDIIEEGRRLLTNLR